MTVILGRKPGGAGGGGAPSGPAGGDLSGNYPNPTLAGDAVETAAIQDGAVTVAKLDFVGCRVTDAAQSIASGSFPGEAIQFSNEDWDTDGFHDNAVQNTRITVPIGFGGKYLIGGGGEWATGVVGQRALYIRRSGVNLAGDRKDAEGDFIFHSIVTEIALAAGDILELFAYHTQGAPLDFNSASFWVQQIDN